MREKIFNIIQIGDKSNRISRAFDIFITITIVSNILVTFLQTFEELDFLSGFFFVVAVITLAALLPLLWVFRKKRPEKSGVKGAATPSPGEAVSGKTDKTTIYRTKPE